MEKIDELKKELKELGYVNPLELKKKYIENILECNSKEISDIFNKINCAGDEPVTIDAIYDGRKYYNFLTILGFNCKYYNNKIVIDVYGTPTQTTTSNSSSDLALLGGLLLGGLLF